MAISYTNTTDGVDWAALKADLAADRFDNGRTVAQYERSFRSSARVVFAWGDQQAFYEKLGFETQPTGMGLVVGQF